MSNYQASSIEVLQGLDPVRRRPGMYTDTASPTHIIMEVIDNSVDEALAGYCTHIRIQIDGTNTISVEDNGRGMPVDIHPEHGVSGVELILTKLHAGGKFSQNTYAYAGGLHGVGVSVVNALSEHMLVSVKRLGKEYQMEFARGEAVIPLRQVANVPKRQTGTKISFRPDSTYFDNSKPDIERLIRLLRAKAVLCPGLDIQFEDICTNKTWHWNYPNGLREYIDSNIAWSTLLEEPVFCNPSRDNFHIDLAMQWLEDVGETMQESYVNLIPTLSGGTHVNGMRLGMLDAIREYCDLYKLLPKNLKITTDDITRKLVYVLSVKMPDPQFQGQTKERLSSREASSQVSSLVRDAFSIWLHSHRGHAQLLISQCIDNALARTREIKQVIRKKTTSGPTLPGKLTDCLSRDPRECELFLVEGDSAGGSARQARDKEFQAVMPLRGKILNTWEVDSHQIFQSKEIHDIAVSLGIDIGLTSTERLRYHKICILADADSDGQHIASLLCALFIRHFPLLVEQQHIYIAMPPLYRVDCGKKIWYALDDIELRHILQKWCEGKKSQTTRFKGLGEMNPQQLKETAMAPATRRLIQLELGNQPQQTIEKLDMLLARKRSFERRLWLEANGDKANTD